LKDIGGGQGGGKRKLFFLYFLMKIFLFVLGVIVWLIFAWDIENDKDFMTWIWLLTSLLLFLSAFKSRKNTK